MPGGRPAIVETEPVVLADSELLARLFRALGDATRPRLLELLLEEGELHQMELVQRPKGVIPAYRRPCVAVVDVPVHRGQCVKRA